MSRTRIGELELAVDGESVQAPFAQVVSQVVGAIQDGRLAPGTRLPSVRALAGELGLATNTVAKAYRALESEGHVETRGRNGTIVLGSGQHDGLTREAVRFVTASKSSGLALDEAIGLLRRAWTQS